MQLICSRGFIRFAAEDDELPVPSPTYLLQQIYDDHPGVLGYSKGLLCSWTLLDDTFTVQGHPYTILTFTG